MTEVATQAVINISPEYDDSILKLQAEGMKLLEYAKTREITSNEDLTSFTEDLALLATLRRAIEDKRKDYTQPINEHLKGVNASFKVLSAPLDEANEILRGKILAFRQEIEKKRLAAEEANNLRLLAARKEAEANGGEISESVKIIPVADAVPDKVHTGVGSSGVAMIRKFEVVDFVALPDEFKMPDTAKIGKVVRAGIGTIAGVKIWEEENLRITTRKGE